MQAIKTFSEVEDRVSHLVKRIVFVSPNHVIYEVESEAVADACVEDLTEFNAYTVTKDGNWFVSVPL